MNIRLSLIVLLITMPTISQAAEIRISVAQQKALDISVMPASKNTALNSQRFPAEVTIPIDQVRMVSAAQAGLIDELHITTGQMVKKGQILAHLTSPDLLGLQRDYLQANTQQKLAKKCLNRDTELYQDGIIPERRLLETTSRFEETSAQLAQTQQALKLAGVSDAAIRLLTPTTGMSTGMSLTAPITGQVLEQMVTLGQRVDAGMPLYKIAQLSPLWLEIRVPVESLAFIKNGMPVSIPKLQASGQLIAIVRGVNKAEQTTLLRAVINIGADSLYPGQIVEAQIALGLPSKMMQVPTTALSRQGADTVIFVQRQQGFDAVKVKVLFEQGNTAVLDAPILVTDKIAVSGVSAIKGVWLGLGGE